MGQIEDLRMYVAIVDHGSIGRAAEELGIAKSAVSRRLGQLEARYDMRLIDRKPGTWNVSEAGQELYQRALPMLAEADDLETDFMQTSRNLSGPLRVTVANEFGMSFLRPMLFQFIANHPEIELTVDFDDRTIDLDRENYDLAIRITSRDLEDVSQVRLGGTRHGLFASADYLAQHGHPSKPHDLQTHALLHYGPNRRPTWTFDYRGKQARIAFKPALNSNTGAFLRDAAISGLGVIQMPDFVVRAAVDSGALVPVLPDAEFPEFGIHLIHSPQRRLNKRMRAFVSAAQEQCRIFSS